MLFEYGDKGDLENYLTNIRGSIEFNKTECMLPEFRIKKFILEILMAMSYLHNQNIIHRDIKPTNIFLKGKDYII